MVGSSCFSSNNATGQPKVSMRQKTRLRPVWALLQPDMREAFSQQPFQTQTQVGIRSF